MNQDISILFEDWTSVKTPPPMSRCMVWWMSGWVGSSQIIPNQINLDFFILDIFWTFLLKPLQPFTELFLQFQGCLSTFQMNSPKIPFY